MDFQDLYDKINLSGAEPLDNAEIAQRINGGYESTPMMHGDGQQNNVISELMNQLPEPQNVEADVNPDLEADLTSSPDITTGFQIS